MNKCICGARIRKNYPFGKGSKPELKIIVHHAKKCKYYKKKEKYKE